MCPHEAQTYTNTDGLRDSPPRRTQPLGVSYQDPRLVTFARYLRVLQAPALLAAWSTMTGAAGQMIELARAARY
jgi:hypothetical protein